MTVFTYIDRDGYVRAYTKVCNNDWSDEELTAYDIAESRLESAIQDGYLPNESFEIVEEHFKDKAEMREFLKVLKYLETNWCDYDKMMGKQTSPYMVEI